MEDKLDANDTTKDKRERKAKEEKEQEGARRAKKGGTGSGKGRKVRRTEEATGGKHNECIWQQCMSEKTELATTRQGKGPSEPTNNGESRRGCTKARKAVQREHG